MLERWFIITSGAAFSPFLYFVFAALTYNITIQLRVNTICNYVAANGRRIIIWRFLTIVGCLPLPSLFVRFAHLSVMISLSRERGLQWLRYEPLQSLALRFGTNSFLLLDPLY